MVECSLFSFVRRLSAHLDRNSHEGRPEPALTGHWWWGGGGGGGGRGSTETADRWRREKTETADR